MSIPTVKELKELLENVPDDAEIETQWNDMNEEPVLEDFFQVVEEDNKTFLVIMTIL